MACSPLGGGVLSLDAIPPARAPPTDRSRLLAMVAFVQQSAIIAASQALASAGSMIDPAVTLSGSVHYHSSLARHVHVHGGHHSVGHVHDTADIDHPTDEA